MLQRRKQAQCGSLTEQTDGNYWETENGLYRAYLLQVVGGLVMELIVYRHKFSKQQDGF